jgi:hypothetical protein
MEELYIGQKVKDVFGREGKVENLSTECGPNYASVRFNGPSDWLPVQVPKENLTPAE